MYLLYNMIILVAAIFALPYYLVKSLLTGKYRRSMGQKLGFIKTRVNSEKKRPRVWFHAVSVGEVAAVRPIIEAFRANLPEVYIIVSTSTETGQDVARQTIAAQAHIYYPLDIPLVVNKVLDLLKPDIFVTTETELWPNFSRSCARRGIKMVMVNGRISLRSFRRYRETIFFWRQVLNNYAAVGVISEDHAARFIELGLPRDRICVLGNAKYDGLAARAGEGRDLAARLNVIAGDLVFVAGSTHEGEEEVILDVYRKLLADFPALRLILVPRHIERTKQVMGHLMASGFSDAVTFSALNQRQAVGARVVLVDVIGELFKIYSLATVVFCGGSLVPKGGQNILEAAAWGKVVFFGTHMDDFPEEAAGLEQSGGGIRVAGGDELLAGIRRLLYDPELCAQLGRQGQEMVKANMGAAAKYAGLIKDAI